MTDPNDYVAQLFAQPANIMQGTGAVDAYGKNMAAAMAQGAQGLGQAGMQTMQSYINDYQPYDKKFMGYVDNLGTDAYRSQQRGQAMTSVQQQIDAQRQQTGRQMAAMGINPNSGRFASMQGQMDMQGALGKAQAATMADRSAREEWKSGLGAINAMGLKAGELGQRSLQTAGELGKVGMVGADLGASADDRRTQAGASATSAGAAAMNAGTNATNAANQYTLGLGRLAFDREALASGAYFKQQGLDDTRQQNSWGNVVASNLAGAAAKDIFSKDSAILGFMEKYFADKAPAPSGPQMSVDPSYRPLNVNDLIK